MLYIFVYYTEPHAKFWQNEEEKANPHMKAIYKLGKLSIHIDKKKAYILHKAMFTFQRAFKPCAQKKIINMFLNMTLHMKWSSLIFKVWNNQKKFIM